MGGETKSEQADEVRAAIEGTSISSSRRAYEVNTHMKGPALDVWNPNGSTVPKIPFDVFKALHSAGYFVTGTVEKNTADEEKTPVLRVFLGHESRGDIEVGRLSAIEEAEEVLNDIAKEPSPEKTDGAIEMLEALGFEVEEEVVTNLTIN